jgi:hypothetical protein
LELIALKERDKEIKKTEEDEEAARWNKIRQG